MVPRERRSAVRGLLIALFACALLAPAPAAAQVKPFGTVDCSPQDGVRYCPGSVATRPKSFDGLPLDVNVTLPGSGEGPFPLVVQLHGYGGAKGGLSESKPFAERGYAVLNYTARGFGNSCGSESSRTADPTGCARGWVRLKDSRFEIRDTQHLAGVLADQGLVIPRKVGVTGGSYGGGESLQLATLRNRIRKPDGAYEPWKSPGGLDMEIAAAAPFIPWTDLPYSLVPNGRTLDYTLTGDTDDLQPIGVLKQSYVAGLYASGEASGFYAPPRADTDADLTSWFGALNQGEPYDTNPLVVEARDELAQNHSAFYLDMSPPPAPTLISNGFTDDLFPVNEALRWTNRVLARHPDAVISQLHFDYGHARGQNKAPDLALFRTRIFQWFDRHLKGVESGGPTGGVEVLTQTCPKEAPAEGPYGAPSWGAIHPGEARFAQPAARTITSAGGDPAIARSIDPIGGGGACVSTPAADQTGTATYRLPKVTGTAYTLIGSPTIAADLQVTGARIQDTQIALRLWDVAANGASQVLAARGVYRPDRSGRAVFQLFPGAYRFEPDHTPKLELLGQDAPFLRASNGAFQITVSNLELRLPTRERPDCAQVLAPAEPLLPAGATIAPGSVPPGAGGACTPQVSDPQVFNGPAGGGSGTDGPRGTDGITQPLPGVSAGGLPGAGGGQGGPRPAAGRACLAGSLRVGSRGIGRRLRLGQRAGRVMRDLGRPSARRRSTLVYCVRGRGRGRVAIVLSRRGDVRLVATTARGHRARGVRPGASLRRLRRSYPRARRLGRGVFATSRSSRIVFGVRRGRVTFVAVADRRLVKRPSRLGPYLRRAGV